MAIVHHKKPRRAGEIGPKGADRTSAAHCQARDGLSAGKNQIICKDVRVKIHFTTTINQVAVFFSRQDCEQLASWKKGDIKRVSPQTIKRLRRILSGF